MGLLRILTTIMPNRKEKSEDHYCRVCGLYQETPPHGQSGCEPSFEICNCCGVEFGYEDLTRETVVQFRSVWIANGCKWFDPELQPASWNLDRQMANVPAKFA